MQLSMKKLDKIIILIPFSLPIFIYLWVKRYRPCHKVNPANDLTKDIQCLWMLDGNSYESMFDTGKEHKQNNDNYQC